jgi:hypothetical protein
MNLTDEQLERCGLCYSTCKCYKTLNDQPYCGCTGKLTKIKSYCHALESTKGRMSIDPYDHFPDTIKLECSSKSYLLLEVGVKNYQRLVTCAELRGVYETFIHKTVYEFNWFVRVINLGNLSGIDVNSLTNEEYKYLYDKYSRYSDASLDELIEQFENYCKERYGE